MFDPQLRLDLIGKEGGMEVGVDGPGVGDERISKIGVGTIEAAQGKRADARTALHRQIFAGRQRDAERRIVVGIVLAQPAGTEAETASGVAKAFLLLEARESAGEGKEGE